MGPASTALVQGLDPEHQVVRLHNNMERPFMSQYANVTYTIQPDQDAFVPFLAMCLWLGHPDAVDIDEKQRYRHEEFTRLTSRYGTYDDLEQWFANKPDVSAFTVEGEQMITVVDDYEGHHLTPDSGTSVAEKQALLASMARMQSQMAAMQAELAKLSRGETAMEMSDLVTDEKVAEPEVTPPENTGGEVTTDRPSKVIVG